MPIYDKPVWSLMRDMCQSMSLGPGDSFTKQQALDWFAESYPKIKASTVDAHLTLLSTNVPSRVHHHPKPDRHDLLFRINTNHFRLYSPQTDLPPIYTMEAKSEADSPSPPAAGPDSESDVDFSASWSRPGTAPGHRPRDYHASAVWSGADAPPIADATGDLDSWARPRGPRWEVVETLGRGGMGIVFKCRDRRLNRFVAVKRVLSLTGNARQRFWVEAQAIAALNHPNILQIHDYDEDDAGPYVIMELATGKDLEAQVKAEGPLGLEEAIEVMKAMGAALSQAHSWTDPETGEPYLILHRDIKPSNILRMADGTPKLSDFGLARLSGGPTVTLTGTALGTPAYMAPEQFSEAHRVGPEADLCSLGKTLYFLLTGRIPSMVMMDHLPKPIRPVVMRCLEERPEDRYRTAEEFVAAIEEVTRQSGKARRGTEEEERYGRLPGRLASNFEIPSESADPYGNPVRRGADPETGWPLEIAQTKTGTRLIFVPPGEFMMGRRRSPKETVAEYGGEEEWYKREHRRHKVVLSRPFYLGKYPVTVGEFRQFVGEKNYRTEAETGDGAHVWTGKEWEKKREAHWRNTGFEQASTNPVVCVSWNDVQAYCRWSGGQLPTEAQWEYACKAGSDDVYGFGDSRSELGEYAWFHGNSGDRTHPVGEKKPNAWGLYDTHGNVWEWCEDWYGDHQDREVVDPTGPEEGSYRVYRGGSWDSGAVFCRSAYRFRYSPDSRYNSLGCRLLLRP